MNLPWRHPDDEPPHWSAARKVEQQIANGRHARRDKFERALAAAKSRGQNTAVLEATYAEEERKRRHEELERIEQAAKRDRRRRLAPYKRLRREKTLLSAGVKITLPNEDAVGVDSFLTQVVERSGQFVTVQPQLGVETEVLPGYVVIRAGSYLEPSRFKEGLERVHFTGGADVHIPVQWDIFGLVDEETTFRVGGAIDRTARYFAWGLTGGIWR